MLKEIIQEENITKSIPFSLEELKELKSKYSTPYYIYDGDSIKSNSYNFIDTFKSSFPEFQQFYAVKALPNLSILKLLKDCGMGFDCSSPDEIKAVRWIDSLDFQYTGQHSDSPIFYTSNFTSASHINFALKNNCLLNLDDIDGLDNLLQSNVKIPETICFRYNPYINVNPDIKSNNFVGSKSKFGMDSNIIIKAYEKAKELGVKNFGLHSMCVSNELDLNVWEDIIESLFYMVNELYKRYLIKIDFINIGGGLGIPYKPNDISINLNEFVSKLKEYWKINISKYSIDWDIKLYTECGRYITGPYGYLVSTCSSIKKTSYNNIFYGLDACMANLMRPGMYNSYHHISIPRLDYISEKIKGNVVGTLCENNDWFCSNRDLPKGIKKGDLMVIHDVGAHSFSMGFNYNSKLKSPELLKLNNNIQLIRKRENYNDLYGNCVYNYYNEEIEKFNKYMFIIILYMLLFLITSFCYLIYRDIINK